MVTPFATADVAYETARELFGESFLSAGMVGCCECRRPMEPWRDGPSGAAGYACLEYGQAVHLTDRDSVDREVWQTHVQEHRLAERIGDDRRRRVALAAVWIHFQIDPRPAPGGPHVVKASRRVKAMA